MAEKYRRNENCIIGLPRCDYVFNSNRSCFIAYGFSESKLEVDILRGLLREDNIEVFEAGGDLEPGKNAFCTKICSKIITSQFCIILLNKDTKGDNKIPNANVNIEYGLMLGFNKYIVPFQRESEDLPFNVSGLDTIKYNQSNFKERAEGIIKKAIEQSRPKITTGIPHDRIINSFLLVKDTLMCPIDDLGNRNIYDLGSPFGYNLINDYSGLHYYFLGVFNLYSEDQIKWRINKLEQTLIARFSDKVLSEKARLQAIDKRSISAVKKLIKNIRAWIVVQTEAQKIALLEYVKNRKVPFEFFSIKEIQEEIEKQKIY